MHSLKLMYLNYKDFSSCREVCSEWKSFIDAQKLGWKRILSQYENGTFLLDLNTGHTLMQSSTQNWLKTMALFNATGINGPSRTQYKTIVIHCKYLQLDYSGITSFRHIVITKKSIVHYRSTIFSNIGRAALGTAFHPYVERTYVP